MDWLLVSGFIGLVLPVLIEIFSKKVTGQKKILIVFVCCVVASIVQTGVDGGFVGWNWSQFAGSTMVILFASVNMWSVMWKKWFPDDSDPIVLQMTQSAYAEALKMQDHMGSQK